MSVLMRHLMLIVLLFAVGGCSSARKSVDGWLDGEGSASASRRSAEAGKGWQNKYAASLHINEFEDRRKAANPRWLGKSVLPIRGMPRNQVVIDQEVSSAVTSVIKERFSEAGYRVIEAGNTSASFEVFGVIKELTLNVLDRDEINIEIETTVKDSATGQVVWSGLVTEKNDRFAGVSGNSKDDIVDYLNEELTIAVNKTVEAVSASLMAAQPELFNQQGPGGKILPGVTVYTAPAVAVPSPAVAPAATAAVKPARAAQPAAALQPAPVPFTSPTAGLLVVTTNPPRAKVYLDEVYYGLTPLRVEMDPGVHALSVKLAGYKMVTEQVSVRKGGTTEMELVLER